MDTIRRLVPRSRTGDRCEWAVIGEDGGDERHENVSRDVRQHFIQWIDTLGQESAIAQNLKQPITCWEKIRPDGAKAYSPVKIVDWIYLIIEQKDGTEVSYDPISFLRFGSRSLFLEKEGQLVRQDTTFCALDFYCREQRNGFGLLLFSEALRHHAMTAQNVAFDRPTPAMVSFLQKHFSLRNPMAQHNRFVIFDGFFNDVQQA